MGSTQRNLAESDTRQRPKDHWRGEDHRAPPGSFGSSDPRHSKSSGGEPREAGREGARSSTASGGRRSGERGVSSKQANYWSTSRFEQLSKQGAFDLKRLDDVTGTWGLKIWMNELEPPMGDEDMQVYCRWLHHRLHKVREECGLRSLRQVRTEVNFSKNGLGDDALGRLLQALQRSELHVISLNFFANRLTPAGAHHVFDFLWSASFPVLEIHLSHNEIDDESALELIRVLSEHPKYQPRRVREGSAELQFPPVWLRLNNNWIRHPHKLLRTLESQLGVTFCLARNRHACGPNKCGHRGLNVPLVHLYTFETQDDPSPSDDSMEERSGQKHRELQPLHRQMGERGEYSAPSLPRQQRRWTASMPALPESPGSPSSSSGSPQPGGGRSGAPPSGPPPAMLLPGSSSVALAVRQSARSQGQTSMPHSIAAAVAPDLSDQPGGSRKTEAVSADADSTVLALSSARDTSDTAAESGPSHSLVAAAFPVAPQVLARPPSAPAAAQPGSRRAAAPSTAAPGGKPSGSGGASRRGVPEVTPEPDGQGGQGASPGPAKSTPPPSEAPKSRASKVTDPSEEEEAMKPARPPKLLAPPKILQRGSKPVGQAAPPIATSAAGTPASVALPLEESRAH